MQKLLKHKKWDLVFNICEGMYGSGREAQVPALLDAFQIPYTFSDPLVLALTLNKAMTKRVIRDAGLITTPFYLIENGNDITYDIDYPMFIKPNSEGSGKGISINSKVNNGTEYYNLCQSFWTVAPTTLIVEKYLPGKEFTVGIVGTGKESKVLGCMEVNFNSDEKFYSYNMKTNYEENVTYTLAKKEVSDKVCELALESWKVLGCRDAGRVDIRLCRYGEPNFIEVNPLAGLNKETSDLPILAKMNGFSYEYIIEQIIESAKKRIK
jgi:D-alanine-D-alanine ligase